MDAIHPAVGGVAIIVLREAQREGRVVQPCDIEVEQQYPEHVLGGLLGPSVPGFVESIDLTLDVELIGQCLDLGVVGPSVNVERAGMPAVYLGKIWVACHYCVVCPSDFTSSGVG